MADTRTKLAAERREIYEREVAFREMVEKTFWTRFMGEANGAKKKESGQGSPVQVKTELEKESGKLIKFYMGWALAGDGVEDDEPLEGNEEDLNTQYDEVTLHLYRHAVINSGALDKQYSAYDQEKEMNIRLKEWGTRKIDKLCFDAIQLTPTKVFYMLSTGPTAASGAAAYATAKAAITAADSKLTVNLIRVLNTWALTGGNGGQSIIPPFMVDGEECYGLLIHPDVKYDLQDDSDYDNAVKDAEKRGKDNPLFTGALAKVDGTIIYPHRRMEIFSDGGSGSNVPGAKCILFGAGALCVAWGRRPYQTKDSRDWGNKNGISWNVILGVKNPGFIKESTDSYDKAYGTIGVCVSRTAISSL